MQKPDNNRPSWQEMGMLTAMMWSKRSPDPNTKVGAVLMSPKNVILGIGYNGFPRGCGVNLLPWDKEGPLEKTKYGYVQHAEKNAILNSSTRDLSGCSIFTTLYPCHDCAGMIIQVGIRQVYYLVNKYADTSSCKSAAKMFDLADITVQQMEISDNTRQLCLDLFTTP